MDKLQDVWKNLIKVIGEEYLREMFRAVMSGIKVKQDGSNTNIDITYENYYGYVLPYASWDVIDNEYRLVLSPKLDYLKPFYYDSTQKELFYFLSKFIVKAFCYDLLSNLIENKASLDIKNPTRKEKADLKTTADKLENMPVAVVGIGNEFSQEIQHMGGLLSSQLYSVKSEIDSLESDYYPKYTDLGQLEGVGPVTTKKLKDSGIRTINDLVRSNSQELAESLDWEDWEDNEGVKKANTLIQQAKALIGSRKGKKPIYRCDDNRPKTVTKILPFGVWKLCNRHANKYIFS
jgi:hypothetical protein